MAKGKAIVRYRRAKPVIKYRTRYVKKRTRRRRSSSSSSTRINKSVIVAAAALGYLQEQTQTLQALPEAVQPTTAKGTLLLGGALYLANKHMMRSKYVGAAAQATLIVGAYKLGQGGFSIQGDEGGEVSGYV